ncbi:D-amino acid dehydrogenase [Kaistia adipata]|uniref:D-amino acid dehydrogenase n=1 Tax=Kaistia adipata TaxID=166954 RepID=UPI00040A71A3|nr:D-amino acid dehydrogenase [Kaistia adipata]
MRIIVLGGGVIGVTTAYALRQEGHEVVLLEKEPAAGLGTSYANAAQISPALSAPWAVPGLVGKALHWMFEKYPPLIISKFPDPEMVRWLWRMWRAASPEQYERSKRAMVAIGEYSRDRFRELRSAIQIDYDGRDRGTLVLFRSEKQLGIYERDMKTLAAMGVPAETLRPDALALREPNLAIRENGIVGAALLPGDETGDCHRFTQALAAQCVQDGVSFRYGETIRELKVSGDRVRSVITDKDEYSCDAVVTCLGVGSARLLAPLGIKLPIYPLKGYSLTIQADSDAIGPHSTVSDETFKIGVTYLGDRIRVGGTAELAGYNLSRPEHRYKGLEYVAQALYPKISREAIANAERWSGLRPMTPDGPPVIGKTGISNLYLNTGHGTLGWTMSCGAAGVLADLVAGRRPAVDISAFSGTRYQ